MSIIHQVFIKSSDYETEPVCIASFTEEDVAHKFVRGMIAISEDVQTVTAFFHEERRKLYNNEILSCGEEATVEIRKLLPYLSKHPSTTGYAESKRLWAEHILAFVRDKFIPDSVFRFGISEDIRDYLKLKPAPCYTLKGPCERYDVESLETEDRLPDYVWQYVFLHKDK